MNYFDIYFQGESAQEILKKWNNPEFERDLNKKEAKKYFQSLFHKLFRQWTKQKILKAKHIYDNGFKLRRHEDNSELSDEEFEMIEDFTVRTETLYLANLDFDKNENDEYCKLFYFRGICSALMKLGENEQVFFINKHSIINLIDTYLLGKWIDYYLRITAPLDQKRKFEAENKHFFEVFLKSALGYTYKNVDTKTDTPIITAKKLASNQYNETFKKIMLLFQSHLSTCEQHEYKRDRLFECIYNYRNFRVEVLSEVSKYLITYEELEDESKLFKMTHQKRLLLYDLLRYLEPQKELPTNQKTYATTSTSDKNLAQTDKAKFFRKTLRFDDFQRDEVRKVFG